MTPTEQNYSQIEKEMYAIVFGCERFRHYIYGRIVTVTSDHKPLESILKKPIALAPPRLQRMIMRIQKYSIDVKYRSGKQIPVADTLSRKSLTKIENQEEAFDEYVHSVVSHLPVSDKKFEELRQATVNDKQLNQVKQVVLNGWPEKRDQCPKSVLEFWNYKDELSVNEEIIMKSERIIVPTALREEMINRIHSGHMGIEKCKSRARDVLFWPNMNKDIEVKVANCKVCQEHQLANARELMIPRETPELPWQSFATDLFSLENMDFVLVVDYYSRYFEIERLRNTKTSTVIKKIKAIFARHGVPQEVISDNGPQYSTEEFSHFSEKWGFRHVTCSP